MRILDKEHMNYFEHLMNAQHDSVPYQFRNFSCRHRNVQMYWSVCGGLLTTSGYGGGVLEWCYDQEDAEAVQKRMLKDPTIINPTVYHERQHNQPATGHKTKDQRRKEANERNFFRNINKCHKSILWEEFYRASQWHAESPKPTLKIHRQVPDNVFLNRAYDEKSKLLTSIGYLDKDYNYEKCVIRMTEEEMFIEMGRELVETETCQRVFRSGQIPKKLAELEIQRRGLYKNAGLEMKYQLLSLI